VTRLVLSCPSLTELVLDGTFDLAVRVVDNLVWRIASRLPRERAVTLGVNGWVLRRRRALVADSDAADRAVGGHRGPLRLVPANVLDRQYSTPLHNPYLRWKKYRSLV